MERRNTKEIIQLEALTLFSVHGFEGVSVRDIAKAVGIKDSSLYKHYRSKQEIFDSILEEVSQRIQHAYERLDMPNGEHVVSTYLTISLDTLEELCTGLFLFYMKDEVVSQFRRMLMIEQYRNSKVSALYRQFFIEAPLQYEAELFRELMNKQLFKKCDPYTTALHFYSPLFLMMSKYDSSSLDESEIRSRIKAHIEAFASHYLLN